MERKQMPSFGNWSFYDDVPVTQFFEPSKSPDPFHCHFLSKEADLFKVPPSPLFYYYQQPTNIEHKQQQQLRQKQERGASAVPYKQRRKRPQKAVDEDLYKIPPEFLYQKRKNRVVLSDFWKRCLGLNCVQ